MASILGMKTIVRSCYQLSHKMALSKSEVPGVYHCCESVLSILNSDKYVDLDEAQELLSIYEDVKSREKEIPANTKRKPFIVFEGLDGCGKSTLTKLLTKKLFGQLRSTPPACLQPLRDSFDRHPQELRRAYYSLGNYIAAAETSLLTVTTPVVMDRFWHSTAAYSIANADMQGTAPVPAESDAIYVWPSDLLKPDIVIFLDVSEDMRLVRLKNRKQFTKEEDDLKNNPGFRKILASAYKTMRDPSVTVVNANLAPKKVLASVMAVLEEKGILDSV